MPTNRRISSTSLSAQVIHYLLQAGHTQADVARMLNVSQGFVSLVKVRERGLTLDHLERIAMKLDVPLGAFLLAVTEPKEGNRTRAGQAILTEAIKMAD